MKRLLFSLFILFTFACLSSSAHMGLTASGGGVVSAGGAACDTDITEDFSVDTNWDLSEGCSQVMSVSGGVISPAVDGYDTMARYSAETTDTVTHWAKTQRTDAVSNGDYGGVILGASDGGNGYWIIADGNTVKLFSVSGCSGTEDASDTLAMSTNDYIAAAVVHSGSNYTFSVWKNPSGDPDCPDGWGVADVTFGPLTPTIEYSTQKGVGVFGYDDNTDLDNFTAGDWSGS